MKSLQALLAILVCAFLPLHAASLADLTYTTTDGKVTITDCDETATGELIIPDTIEGNPVTSIGLQAFQACSSLTSITIPDSVTSIESIAFQACTSLTNITIPDSVTSIGDYAFFRCTSLTSITIPEGVTSIENSVFASCSSLPSITIPDSVTSIGDFTFYNCASLTSITLPENLTSIGEEAFDECTNLGTVTFQGPAPTVGNDAFAGLPTSASAIVKVGNLSSFGANLSNWNGLTVDTILTWTTTNGEVTITDCDETATGELIIPDTIEGNPVTSIANFTFSSCRNLESITIPDSVTTIGDSAFYNCTRLTSIMIPNSVISIGGRAFDSCTSLTNITIPDSVTSIGVGVFEDCTSLTSITIGNGVISIGSGAFYNCSSLTSITFQGVAPTVGTNAFSNTPDGAVALVTSANLVSFGENGSSWNGLTLEVIPVLSWITNNGEVTITDCDETATGELIIPDTIEGNPVTSIGNDAFRDCGSLTGITIPDGVTSIGVAAFRNCSSLTSMTIPDSVTSIGGAAFFSCTSLTSITIPDGVTSIENGTFRSCTSLTSITIPDGVTSIGSQAFFGSPAVIEVRPVTQNQLAAQLAAVTAERDAAIAERNDRFTEDQINAMTTDPTIGRNAAGNMQVDISFIHSTDLQTFTPFAVNPAWVSVVDGKIALEFPPSNENTFFYRLGVQ